MAQFPLHTRATAPFEAKPILDQAGQAIGYVPALLAQMAEAPALLEGYAALSAIFRKTGFTPAEQQLVLLTASVEHDSHYCTPAHTVRARAAAIDEATLAAVRAGRPVADPRLEALRLFTVRMIRERGFLADADHGRIEHGDRLLRRLRDDRGLRLHQHHQRILGIRRLRGRRDRCERHGHPR